MRVWTRERWSAVASGRRFLGITYTLTLAIAFALPHAGIAPLIPCVRQHRRNKELRRAPEREVECAWLEGAALSDHGAQEGVLAA
jgi:hypothetical protein